MNLGAHTSEHRRFLIFAPRPDDAAYALQCDLLAGEDASFAERDLLRGDFFFSTANGTFAGEKVSPAEAHAARERYGVEEDRFEAVLVGKDGGVKHRSAEPVAPAQLYVLIDAMPMRRREMREHEADVRGAEEAGQ